MVRKRPIRAISLIGATVAATVLTIGGPAQGASAASGDWLPATPANWAQVVDEQSTTPFQVTHGVSEYSETYDTVGGAQHTQMMDVNLADPNVRLGVVEAGDSITDPADETVSSMAARTGAVAGVNGDYFEINATGRPLGGVISNGVVLKSPRPDYNAQLGVRPDGSMVLGQENFTGTITDGPASDPLTSVNVVNDLATGGITEVTTALGAATGLPASTLVVGHPGAAGQLVVDSVRTGVTALPALPAGQEDLLGGGVGGQWLAATVHAGDPLTIATRISPDNNLTQLISGATMLVKGGQVDTDPTGNPPGGVNPETAVGLTQDGRHAIIVTLDGHQSEPVAAGVTPAQVAGYLVAHGAYTGVLFDGGGSTEMVGREPGAAGTSVLNTPSDGTERPVSNGIFIYSNEQHAGPATAVSIGNGRSVTTVDKTAVPLPVRATDALDNPAVTAPSVRVVPGSLGSWANGTLTVHGPGVGEIVATDGRAVSVQPLRVVDRLASAGLSPARPDLNNGGSQNFTLTGATTGDAAVPIPAAAASWSVSPSSLGSVDSNGLFTAAATGAGLATVTARVAGATATASVAVGSVSTTVDDLSDVSNWNLRNTTGDPATVTLAPGVVPPGSTASGSLQLAYTMPAGTGVKQLVLSAERSLPITATADGRDPTGIGLWVKGNGTGIELAESYLSVDGTSTTLYPTTVTWQGWQLVVAQLPAGLNFPLSVSFLDFLAISPSQTTGGTLDVAGLQELYSPRPVVTPPYTAIPANPSWLRFQENAADFSRTGQTLLAGGNAGLSAADPGSTGAAVLGAVAGRIGSLPTQAKPETVQLLGNLSADGTPADLALARSQLTGLGVVAGHDAVGGGETSKGALPETGNFAQAFGDTHYAYSAGAAEVIVTDSSHGGLLASDPDQSPAQAQYPWLVGQLTQDTAPTVVVATNLPAYDPHNTATDQFSDRWEAQMYVRLIQRYQQTHPDRHVLMLAGDATGFAEQLLDPTGQQVSAAQGGIPQFTVADLGVAAATPADQGGFANVGLFRVDPAGAVQFTVEPVLSRITVAVPQPRLAAGGAETLTATGTEAVGDNLPAAIMPIADPASHVWSVSDPGIATVDATSGVLTAHRPGSVTVSVSSGGVTASGTVTVLPAGSV
ncbi:MAG TPA: phosphodiester glycosidase family protein [Pseudonocardiaceae bacterium]|jgi:exopolysaccharide biosynthesis protein|nr:phosphodiester glycosidase family protein [Pseudonocardiaceae bacterium]